MLFSQCKERSTLFFIWFSEANWMEAVWFTSCVKFKLLSSLSYNGIKAFSTLTWNYKVIRHDN